MNNTFEIEGVFHLSKLEDKFPSFVIKDSEGVEKQFYTTEKSKSFAEKLSGGDGVRVTYKWNSRPGKTNGFWNTYVNALKVEKLNYTPGI